MIEIHSDPCTCPPGKCEACFGEDDKGQCVNRLPNAAIAPCATCQTLTWHSEGNCLRCKAIKEGHA